MFMIDILFMLEYYLDSLEWKISACWSILAKNHIIILKKCMFMIDILFMLEYCSDDLEWSLVTYWSILAKNYIISLERMYVYHRYTLYDTVLLQQYCTVLYSTVQHCIYIYGALWGPRVLGPSQRPFTEASFTEAPWSRSLGPGSSKIDDRWPIFNDQWSIIDDRSSMIDHRSSIIDHRSSIVDRRSSINDHHPLRIDHRCSTESMESMESINYMEYMDSMDYMDCLQRFPWTPWVPKIPWISYGI